MFTDAITHTSDYLVKGLEDTLERNRDNPVKAITECFEFYVTLLEKHQDFAKMIFLVLSELDQEDIREAYLPYQERALKAIASAIDHWKEQGFVPEEMDTKTSAWLYFGSYLILALVKQTTGDIPMDTEYAVELAKPFIEQQFPDS